jgi:hypothetical protein
MGRRHAQSVWTADNHHIKAPGHARANILVRQQHWRCAQALPGAYVQARGIIGGLTMQTNTVVSEDRFLLYKHLKSMREVSVQLEDALQELVDARYSLTESFRFCMTPQVELVIRESTALGVRLETLYLHNEKQIRYVHGLIHETPTNGAE